MTPVSQILVDLLNDLDDPAGLPDRLCRLAVERLPVDAASIALTDETGAGILVAGSDERAVTLEHLQFTLGEGPCHDAHRLGRLVQQPDLVVTGPARWPVYTAAVAELGVRGLFSFPLRIGGIRLGVLDLYADHPGSLADPELATALHVADAAVLLVLHLGSHDPGSAPGEVPLADLASAGLLPDTFRDQPEVHQATGMVSVQLSVPLAEALLLLRAHAFATGRTVGAVADDVVGRRLRFDDDGAHPTTPPALEGGV